MRAFNYHIKHSFSCLPDQKFEVKVDDEFKTVTIIAQTFDSSLIGHVLRSALPDEGVIAYMDDNTRRPDGSNAPFALQIRIGGVNGPLFNAKAVLLVRAVRPGLDLTITMDLVKTEKCAS